MEKIDYSSDLVTLLKMQPLYGQPSRKNATPIQRHIPISLVLESMTNYLPHAELSMHEGGVITLFSHLLHLLETKRFKRAFVNRCLYNFVQTQVFSELL